MAKPTKHRDKWRIRWINHAGQRQSQVFDRYRDAEQALRRHQIEAADIQAGDRLPVIHARHSTHLVSDQAGSDALLGTAEDNWGALEEDGFLMEERPNDGSWVRPWRIALRSFRLPLLHEMSSGSRRPEGLG